MPNLMIGDNVYYLHQIFHWVGACWHNIPVERYICCGGGEVEVFGKYCCVCGKMGNREPRSRWWEGDSYRPGS